MQRARDEYRRALMEIGNLLIGRRRIGSMRWVQTWRVRMQDEKKWNKMVRTQQGLLALRFVLKWWRLVGYARVLQRWSCHAFSAKKMEAIWSHHDTEYRDLLANTAVVIRVHTREQELASRRAAMLIVGSLYQQRQLVFLLGPCSRALSFWSFHSKDSVSPPLSHIVLPTP